MARLQGIGGDGNAIFDPLGIFYITFAAVWTCVVLGGLLWLYSIRDSIAVRIRNFWLVASAVVVLHLYEVCVLIRYPLNGLFKCGAEFWIMSTLLPFSIALFQASNMQLFSYYEEQQNIASFSFKHKGNTLLRLTRQGLLRSWKQLTTLQKVYAGILLGLIVQLIITIILFFGSRSFHRSYGFFGPREPQKKCRISGEWIPSVFWQFIWSVIFGPYVLYKIRFIRDTHYWGLQTRLAVIACLPGTPLWFTFRYANLAGVNAVKKYFSPAMWFMPGLITMQVVSIVIPILDARNQARYNERASSIFSESSSKSKDQYSMSALELMLEHNIEPLLEWTSKKEFTAENIVFLKSVRDYKRKWLLIAQKGELSSRQVRERFEEAGFIYYNLVNQKTALFNINIDHLTYIRLESMFSCLFKITLEPGKESNAVAPWDTSSNRSISEERLVDGVDRIYQSQVTGIELKETAKSVPAEFDINVFDAACTSIKYLVFTNSWVKYIDAQETASLNFSTYSVFSKA